MLKTWSFKKTLKSCTKEFLILQNYRKFIKDFYIKTKENNYKL